ncbi:hypothetical protein ABIA24_002040 [Sinorhizobium fredii]
MRAETRLVIEIVKKDFLGRPDIDNGLCRVSIGVQNLHAETQCRVSVSHVRSPIFPAVALMAITAMTMEEVHQGTGQQQQVGCEPKCMLPVLAENEESDDHRERGGESVHLRFQIISVHSST